MTRSGCQDPDDLGAVPCWTTPAGDCDCPRHVRRQLLPAPPAAQGVCVLHGFDPTWGAPPAALGTLPVHFDPALCAYAYDPQLAARESDPALDPAARATLAQLGRRWEQGAALQPYRVAGAPGWRYRWIPRVRARESSTHGAGALV